MWRDGAHKRSGEDGLARLRVEVLEVEVQLEDVDAWFAEQAKLPGDDVIEDELTDAVFGNVTFTSDARHLVERGGWRDVGVEAGS